MSNGQDCEPHYHLKICLKTINNQLSFTLLRWHYLIEDADSLESLELICGADLDYTIATYLEPK